MDDDTATDSHTGIWARTTAPQSPYTFRQIATGLIVLAIGLLIVFGLPLILL